MNKFFTQIVDKIKENLAWSKLSKLLTKVVFSESWAGVSILTSLFGKLDDYDITEIQWRLEQIQKSLNEILDNRKVSK